MTTPIRMMLSNGGENDADFDGDGAADSDGVVNERKMAMVIRLMKMSLRVMSMMMMRTTTV